MIPGSRDLRCWVSSAPPGTPFSVYDCDSFSWGGKTYGGGHEDTMWTETVYQGRKVRVSVTVMLSKDKVA